MTISAIARITRNMGSAASAVRAAAKAADAAAAIRAMANAADAANDVLASLSNPALRTAFKSAIKSNRKLMDQFAEMAQASRATKSRAFKLLSDAPDLRKSLAESIDNLPPASHRLGKKPSGLASAGRMCGSSPAACLKNVAKLGALGVGTYYGVNFMVKLNSLEEDEKACIGACMPNSAPGVLPVEPNLLTEEEREFTLVVCDGTENTGETYAECEQFCVEECTSLESKCKNLGISWACSTGSGVLDLARTTFDELLDLVGLGGLGDLVKYIIAGIVGLVVLVIVIKIMGMAFGKRSAPAITEVGG